MMLTIKSIYKALVLAALTSASIMSAGSVMAQNAWEQSHPRRVEVNGRASVQNARIRAERREGKITGAQARQLHKEDHQVRQEERAMASQNGGHITHAEKSVLNQQENAISKQIGH